MNSIDTVKMVLEEYFSSRTREFWKRGLQSQPEKWKKITIYNEKNI